VKNPTLVILAAGMASRYGSLKQIDSFGPSGETIIEYAVYDAIRAGFKRVVFIIREDFFEEFKEIFEPKLKGRIDIDYAFQSLTAFTDGYTIPPKRTKPYGTAQALMCCSKILNEPFAIVNADDFYGLEAYQKAYDFLNNKAEENVFASIAYKLKNTLSDNGSVSRGQIYLDKNSQVAEIKERLKILKYDNKIVYDDEENLVELDPETLVSMNFFCFSPAFIGFAMEEFRKFLNTHKNDLKAEFLLPIVADKFIQRHLGVIDVIPTDAHWFGVTYKEDKPIVREELHQLIAKGLYPGNLWK